MSFNFYSGTMKYALAAVALFAASTVSAAEYVATPANGATVDALTSIEVAFTGATTVAETGYATTLSNGVENFRVGTSVNGASYVVDVRSTLANGNYTLNIPAGTVSVDGVANEAISLNYTVAAPAATAVTVTPAAGEVRSLQYFTVTVEGASAVSYIANGTETSAYLAVNGQPRNYFMPYNVTAEGNALTFALSSAVSEAGNYSFVIPANSVAADGVAIEAQNVDYTILAGDPSAAGVSVAPAAGVVDYLNEIVLTVEGASTVAYNPTGYENAVSLTKDGSAVATFSNYMTVVSGNTVTFKAGRDLTEAGEYVLNVPANSVFADGVAIEATTFNYTINEAPYTTPAGEVSTIFNVTVNFPGQETVEYIAEEEADQAYFTKDGVRYIGVQGAMGQGGSLVIFPEHAIISEGNYGLVLPGRAYTFDGANYGKDLTFNFNVTGADYTVTPDYLEEVAEFNKVSFTFDAFEAVAEVGFNTTIKDNAGNVYRCLTSVVGNTYNVAPIDTIRKAGSYIVTIPANTLSLDGVNLESAIETYVNVVPAAVEFSTVVSPAAGNVLGLQNFAITFEGAAAVNSVVDSTEKAPYLANAEGERLTTITSIACEGNVMNLALYAPVAEPGEYKLFVPASGYEIEGAESRNLEFAYNVLPVNVFVTPSEIVDEITTVAFTFDGFNAVTEVKFDGVTLTNEAGNSFRTRTECAYNEFNVISIDTIRAAGNYTVTIPAGTLALDGMVYNQAISTVVTIGSPIADIVATASPAAGSTLATLKEVAVTFEGVKEAVSCVTGTENAPYITKDGERYATITKISNMGNVIYYMLTSEISESGNFALVIPGTGYTVDGVAGIDLKFEYTVKGLSYTVSPENNSTVENLTQVVWTFNGVNEVTELGIPSVQVWDPAYNFARYTTAVAGNQFKVNLIDPVVNGDYYVIVAPNSIALDGEALTEQLMMKVTVAAAATEFNAVADPAEGAELEAVSTINITFEGAASVAAAAELNTETAPYLATAEGERRATFTQISASDNVLTIALLNPYTEEGAVKVVIPAASYTVPNAEARELVFNYSIKSAAGINGIVVEGVARVYNAQGVLLNAEADADAIKALPRGFYIINGKKVVK